MRLVSSKLLLQIGIFNQCVIRLKGYLIYLVLLICLFSTLAGYLSQQTHYKQQLTQLYSEELSLRQQLRKHFAVDANLKKYFNDLNVAKQDLVGALEYSTGSLRPVSYFQNISQLAEKRQLQVLNIQWLTEKTEAAYSIIPVSLELQGNYHSFAHFCSDLSNLSSLIILTDVVINKAYKDLLAFKITVNIYHLDQEFLNNETAN